MNRQAREGPVPIFGFILAIDEMSSEAFWRGFTTKKILGLTGKERLERILLKAGCCSVTVIRAASLKDAAAEFNRKGQCTAMVILAGFLCHETLANKIFRNAQINHTCISGGIGAKSSRKGIGEFLNDIIEKSHSKQTDEHEGLVWRIDYADPWSAVKQTAKLGQKPWGAWFCSNVMRRVSIPASMLFSMTSLRPRHLLWIRLAGCITAGLFIAHGQSAGYLVFFLSMILDCCDGELARIKIECSMEDAALDAHLDHCIYVLIFAATGMDLGGLLGLSIYGTISTILFLVEFKPYPQLGHPSLSSAFAIGTKRRLAGCEAFNICLLIAGVAGPVWAGILVAVALLAIFLLRARAGVKQILNASAGGVK